MNQSIIKLLGATLIITSINLFATSSKADETQPVVHRPKPSFSEQPRKLRFGFGDFLDSALDGSDSFLVTGPLIANFNRFYNPQMQGTLTVDSRDQHSSNFLSTTLTGELLSGELLFLQLNNPHFSGDPRIGTINVVRSTGIAGVTSFQYSGSFSVKGNLVSGAIELFNQKNPAQSIFIQLPPSTVANINNNNTQLMVPVTFSIGLPTDR